MIYNKNAFSIDEHIAQLQARGLAIVDHALAAHYLSHVSYYRLAGYWWPMQVDREQHLFKPNSKFEDVIHLYNFDRELRILIFDAIEKIEISLRTKLIYHLSHEFDPWWFQNITIFQDSGALIETLANLKEEIERSKDIFIKEHKKRYKEDLRFPPAWKSLEMTSFGSLSKLYGNLKNTIKSKDTIAEELGAVNHTYLPSWLQSIAQIRNYCAHHSRLWNKNLPGTPKILSRPPHRWLDDVPTDTQKLYLHLCIIRYMLNIIAPENSFALKMKELLTRYPSVDPNALGFKVNWENEALWN
ncbi:MULTISPECIES: Abi family protein [unclassified Pedobacter]|uniref:Abi family protein n=1 Tax=unclassified Pedobacter TaxID=2628915 RepID=UPI0018253276|nr:MULTISPECIES: Abi family protein [unclassified Pedobacter]NII82086.1 abortive infection bacteriophage resistance protein [Pedobacter sp. SG908]NMN36093.1 abortive infection bacteriophage resistance protein [Pedobacter sp. SG918]